MKMSRKEIKYLVGIYAAIMTMMGVNIPISVLAAVQEAFPNVSGTVVQMIVSLPGLLAIASNLIFSKMAHKIYKKHIVTFCIILFVAGGLIPFFFHSSIVFLFITACLAGFAMGGVQNSLTALTCDYFEGEKRAMVMGLSSVFIGLGGAILTLVASRLGAIHWHYAYLTYLCLIPSLIIMLICMPKGILEEKPTKTNHIKVPAQVIWCCVFGFFMYTACQLFNSNVSMLVSDRGIGSTSEAGNITTIYTVAMMAAGLLVVPFMRVFGRKCFVALFVICGIGCAIMASGRTMLILCIGAIVMSFAYGIFTPVMNKIVSEESPAMGMAFNLALASALCSMGQASSPITTGFAAGLLGGGIATYFITGVAISIIFTVISLFVSKLPRSQQEADSNR